MEDYNEMLSELESEMLKKRLTDYILELYNFSDLLRSEKNYSFIDLEILKEKLNQLDFKETKFIFDNKEQLSLTGSMEEILDEKYEKHMVEFIHEDYKLIDLPEYSSDAYKTNSVFV